MDRKNFNTPEQYEAEATRREQNRDKDTWAEDDAKWYRAEARRLRIEIINAEKRGETHVHRPYYREDGTTTFQSAAFCVECDSFTLGVPDDCPNCGAFFRLPRPRAGVE